jgi:hypothetical protein
MAFAGFEHGLFESLQGNIPTESLIIQAIGKDMQWWEHGSEEAFTLLPNFLLTGILAMAVSMVIIIWSLFFLDRPKGMRIFLLLFLLLVLVGGGIGFIPFFVLTWAYGRRMNGSLEWWKKRLPERWLPRLASLWFPALIITGLAWLISIEIAIFGWVPGLQDPDRILAVCWSMLLLALVFINLTYIFGFARDIKDLRFH